MKYYKATRVYFSKAIYINKEKFFSVIINSLLRARLREFYNILNRYFHKSLPNLFFYLTEQVLSHFLSLSLYVILNLLIFICNHFFTFYIPKKFKSRYTINKNLSFVTLLAGWNNIFASKLGFVAYFCLEMLET